MCEEFFADWGERGNFGKPNGGFNGFDLAEKRAEAHKWVLAPMEQQMGGFPGDLPGGRIGKRSPRGNIMANFVDHGGQVVLLIRGGQSSSVAQIEGLLGALGGSFNNKNVDEIWVCG